MQELQECSGLEVYKNGNTPYKHLKIVNFI